MNCKKCNTDDCPKHEVIAVLNRQKNSILKSYRKDKKFYRIVIGTLGLLILMILTYGARDGVKIVFDYFIK
jgi:hypothetical protein